MKENDQCDQVTAHQCIDRSLMPRGWKRFSGRKRERDVNLAQSQAGPIELYITVEFSKIKTYTGI